MTVRFAIMLHQSHVDRLLAISGERDPRAREGELSVGAEFIARMVSATWPAEVGVSVPVPLRRVLRLAEPTLARLTAEAARRGVDTAALFRAAVEQSEGGPRRSPIRLMLDGERALLAALGPADTIAYLAMIGGGRDRWEDIRKGWEDMPLDEALTKMGQPR